MATCECAFENVKHNLKLCLLMDDTGNTSLPISHPLLARPAVISRACYTSIKNTEDNKAALFGFVEH